MIDKEKLEAQFKVGDIIRNKHWNTAVHKITSMDDKSYCLDNGGKIDLSSQQLWELVKEPVNEEWIEELRTKLDSLSKEEFEQVWGKYRVEEKEEPVSEDLEEACEQLAENARKRKAETSSPFFSQTDYIQGVMDGAMWQKKQIEEVLLSEVLPCFMHGGEADEVVAKLDEVLNQKK